MSQQPHITRVAAPILVSFPSADVAVKAAKTFISSVLYPGENRSVPPIQDEFGDVSFATFAGSLRVVRSINSAEARLEIPRSPFTDGYPLSDQLVGAFRGAGGHFSACGLGSILNRIGDKEIHSAQQSAGNGFGAARQP